MVAAGPFSGTSPQRHLKPVGHSYLPRIGEDSGRTET